MDLGRLYFALRYDQHRYGEKLLKSNPYKSFAQDMSCRSFSIIYLCICFYHISLWASKWDTLVGFCSATKCMAGFPRMPSHARLVWEFAWRFNTVSIDMHTQTSPCMHLLALTCMHFDSPDFLQIKFCSRDGKQFRDLLFDNSKNYRYLQHPYFYSCFVVLCWLYVLSELRTSPWNEKPPAPM